MRLANSQLSGPTVIDTRATQIDADYERWPRVRATIHDSRNPWPLVLFFAHLGESPAFLGFQVLAEEPEPKVEIGTEESLDAKSFARLARTLPMYVDYARAEIEWRHGDRARAMEALREAGKSRRGLPGTHYESIGADYDELVRHGDPHPIKSIAGKYFVDKSRASRWVKEARVRGYIT